MGNVLSDVERKVLGVIQGGLPQTQTPYKDMAEAAGLGVGELLDVLRDWQKNGKMRRIGAIVHHLKAGLAAGAMVVWRVEEKRVEEVGGILGGFEQVSHAYERIKRPDWPYNVYTMVHGVDDKELQVTVEHMSEACGVSDYRMLMTERELRKVPPTYI